MPLSWNRISRLVIISLVTLIITGCNDRPEGVLSESETIDLLADLQLAEAYNNTPQARGSNPFKGDLQEAVLKAHGVSEEVFANTMAYYGRNIDEYYELFDKVEKRIKKKGEKFNGKVQDELEGNDMWPYSRFVYFSKNGSSNGLRFSIDPGDLQSGEILEWKLNFTSADGVDGVLGVEYTDGSSSYVKRNAAGNRKFSITLQSDTARIAKRLFGYVTMPSSSMPAWADSIQLLRMPFDSVEYSKIRMQQRVWPLKTKPSKAELDKEQQMIVAKDSVKEPPVVVDTSRAPAPAVSRPEQMEGHPMTTPQSSAPVKQMAAPPPGVPGKP